MIWICLTGTPSLGSVMNSVAPAESIDSGFPPCSVSGGMVQL